jgi:hypothetical protein
MFTSQKGGFAMRRSPLLVALLVASLVPRVAATDGVPPGWHLAGTHPENYRTGADANGTAFLASKAEGTGAGFGTLMQAVQADEYAGKRVRFRATVRSEDVTGWAGLWMRVDQGSKMVAFDNMQTRPIKGSTGWSTYEVVLNVPADATSISFGVLLDSNGGIWLRSAEFGPVGSDVPTTQVPMPQAPGKPVNLDFKQQGP